MIRRIAFVQRKAGMTVEEFWEHYKGPHADIIQKMPGLRRMVLSRIQKAGNEEWDAVGELWFDDLTALEQAFAKPEIASLLQGDRPLFLGRSSVTIVEEETLWIPASTS